MTDQRGFTLIEILVALAILGLATSGVVAIIRDGSGTADDAIAMRRATLAAESFLDRIGKDVPLPKDGQSEGEWPGGYAWRLTASPAETGTGRRGLAARQVMLTVAWKSGGPPHHLDFQTLLLERSQ